MPTNADALVAVLRDAGVERAFGIPSGPALPVLDAMRRGGITPVLTAHEAAAGFAAEATARVTGVPGVCFGTLGPGATNLATGVGAAFLDRSPLIALTWRAEQRPDGRRVQMQVDHHALFRPLTKASLPLEAGQVAATTADAIALALSEPPGPVHLDITEATSELEATDASASRREPHHPAAGDIADVASVLAAARRPLLVVGANARRLADPTALAGLVERWRLPVASTAMAKGVIDEGMPWAIGCIERGRRQLQREFIASADLVLAIGYDPIEVEYEDWIGETALASVDIEPAPRSTRLDVAAEYVGDLDAALSALASLETRAFAWTPEEVAGHRERFQTALRPASPGFAPHEAIDALQGVTPEGAILAYDVGAHTHQVASQWLTRTPRTHLLTNGWSSMGYGLPAAIGAKLARPETPVLAVLGDGGFQMTSGEVATADELVTNVGRVATPAASHFGAPMVRVDDAESLAAAARDAFEAPGPTVIEAVVDPSSYLETVFD